MVYHGQKIQVPVTAQNESFLAIAFFVPVFNEYLLTGMVTKLPTLVVCGFTMIAAIQSFFAGMQLQVIVQKNRQEFEINLIEANRQKRQMIEIAQGLW